jgi:hypothetical protein
MKKLLLVAALAVASSSVFAATGNIGVTGQVNQASAIAIQNMTIGTVLITTTGTAFNYTLTPQGIASSSNTAVATVTGLAIPGAATITSSPGATVQVTLPASVPLTTTTIGATALTLWPSMQATSLPATTTTAVGANPSCIPLSGGTGVASSCYFKNMSSPYVSAVIGVGAVVQFPANFVPGGAYTASVTVTTIDS